MWKRHQQDVRTGGMSPVPVRDHQLSSAVGGALKWKRHPEEGWKDNFNLPTSSFPQTQESLKLRDIPWLGSSLLLGKENKAMSQLISDACPSPSIFHFNHSNKCAEVFHHGFNLYFLMSNNTEHILCVYFPFMYLFLMNCILKFLAHLLIVLFVFLWIWELLIYSRIQLLCQTYA